MSDSSLREIASVAGVAYGMMIFAFGSKEGMLSKLAFWQSAYILSSALYFLFLHIKIIPLKQS